MLPTEVSRELALFFVGGVALYGLAVLLARRAHPIIAERGGPGWCSIFEVASWLTFICAVVCWPMGFFITLFSHRGDAKLVTLALWFGRIPVISVVAFLGIGVLLLFLSQKHQATALYDEFEDRDIRFREQGVKQAMALLACLLIAGLMGDVMSRKWGGEEPKEKMSSVEKTPEEIHTDRINEAIERNPNMDLEQLDKQLREHENSRH